jgi:hypothetical protein
MLSEAQAKATVTMQTTLNQVLTGLDTGTNIDAFQVAHSAKTYICHRFQIFGLPFHFY